MKAEGFEALQASELCFRLLTHPSFNLMQRLKAGQSRAAKHPNTLLSPSDSHRRRHPVFKSVRRASLICFHSTFFCLSVQASWAPCLLHPIEPSFRCGPPASQRRGIQLKPLRGAILHLPHCHMSEPQSTNHKFSLSLSIDSDEMPTQLEARQPPPPFPPSTLNNRQGSPYWRMWSARFHPLCHWMNWTQSTPNATYLIFFWTTWINIFVAFACRSTDIDIQT